MVSCNNYRNTQKPSFENFLDHLFFLYASASLVGCFKISHPLCSSTFVMEFDSTTLYIQLVLIVLLVESLV